MNETIKMTLKAARINAGKTQAETAESLGISTATLSSWELGKTEPSVSQFHKLCALYGVSIDNVFLPESTN